VSPLRADPPADGSPRRPGTLEAAIRTELERFDRVECPDGAAALYAARMLDAGGHTGASAASLLRECRVAVEAAIKGIAPAGDVVDELKAKRRARSGA
jgi:hypothetical protein